MNMKMMVRFIFTMTAVCLLTVCLAACGKKDGSAAAGVDISKRVTIRIEPFSHTPAPGGLAEVVEAANKILLEKLNCTIDILPMSNWLSRYNLALSSGEPIDLVWTATWWNYQPLAIDGAFLDITDMLDRVAPELRQLFGQENWTMSKIKERDYAFPNLYREFPQWGVAWREDLRKKMGVPPITNWETMELYAEAIKKNYPEMIPFCESQLSGLFHGYGEKYHIFNEFGNPQYSYGIGVRTDNPRRFILYMKEKSFEDFLATQRRWVERGYFQPDAMASTDDGNAGMLAGKYAGSLYNAGIIKVLNAIIVPAKTSHPDWEIGYMNFGEMFQWTYRQHPISMSLAIPRSAENPERTLLFIKELLTNRELWQLLDMGIEGKHYKVENGHYVSLNDPQNPAYPQQLFVNGITQYFFNSEFALFTEEYQWAVDYINDHMVPYEVTNYFQGFPEDTSAYADKVAAMGEIANQYFFPLVDGVFPDPHAALADVNARFDAAGRMEVISSFETQYNAYLDSLGVPK
jgi:putative aldouronate transport system substrate-binding protein